MGSRKQSEQSGDFRRRVAEAAFREAIAAYVPLIARYIRQRIVNASDAEDALQETLIAAWRGFPRLRESTHPQAWLLQIARNRCRDYFRARERRETTLEPETLEVYASRSGLRQHRHRERFAEVRDALETAPAPVRETLQLFYGEGWTIAEIAADRNRPTGTVKRQLFQARRALRAALDFSFPTLTPSPLSRENKTMPTQTPDALPMPAFPATLPTIRVTELDEPPFAVDCREIRCWSIVPVVGESATTADYGLPGWSLGEVTALRALGAATVHGVEGVEIEVRQWKPEAGWQPRTGTIVARLTERKAEFLAVHLLHEDETQFETFLDENFAWNWGAVDRALADTGRVQQSADGAIIVTNDANSPLPDGVGAGLVRLEIGDRAFRCLRVLNFLDVDSLRKSENYLAESYLTEAGKTVLVRRYCPPSFAEVAQFPVVLDPDVTRTVNGITCLHWYDTLTGVALSDSCP